MWTGKSLAAIIEREFGVSFHPQSVPRLLHEIGFSLQRPRKRLARADPEAQAAWARDRLPAMKKKPRRAVE
jgi:transposase